MKHAAVFAALGVASLASGQEWRFELSEPVLSPGNPSTTVTASIDPGLGAWAFYAANFDVHATAPGWSEPTALWAGSMLGQNPGVISGASVVGISVGQLSGFGGWPPGFPKLGRVEVWQATFTVTDFSPRQIEVSTETSRLDVYLDEMLKRETRIPLEAVATIEVVPAPGALALLGLGGLAAARRGRRRPERDVWQGETA